MPSFKVYIVWEETDSFVTRFLTKPILIKDNKHVKAIIINGDNCGETVVEAFNFTAHGYVLFMVVHIEIRGVTLEKARMI